MAGFPLFIVWLSFLEERALSRHAGRPGGRLNDAAAATVQVAALFVGFGLAVLVLLAVFGGLLVGFLWLTHGIGPVRGAVVGAGAAGLVVLLGRTPVDRQKG